MSLTTFSLAGGDRETANLFTVLTLLSFILPQNFSPQFLFNPTKRFLFQQKNTLKFYDSVSLNQTNSTVMNPANDLCRDIYLVLFN
jgi:hypothetical protein